MVITAAALPVAGEEVTVVPPSGTLPRKTRPNPCVSGRWMLVSQGILKPVTGKWGYGRGVDDVSIEPPQSIR